MCRMTVIQWMLLVALLLEDAFALKDVVLTIQPKVVRRYGQSTLRCTYDLEGATLYSVKWYRGKYEFYRYTPSEHPSSKVFPFAGIAVDVRRSNSTQVVLIDIEFNLSGNFSCEVTTTDMPVATGTNSQSMLVVQLPDEPPAISVGRAPLDYGDTLRANCSSPPSRPPADLKFVLNNWTVAWSEPRTPRQAVDYSWSDLTLELQLGAIHFNNGKLLLRCVARVADIYQEEAVLELDSVRHPIPQRVSVADAADRQAAPAALMLVAVVALGGVGAPSC